MRLVKYIAQRTPLSRRAADRLIQKQGVFLNHCLTFDPATFVHPGAHVCLEKDAAPLPVNPPDIQLFMYHKPAGVLTTRYDPQNRPTLFDILPTHAPDNLMPIGRLDKDTEGLMLLTNNGALKRTLELPATGLKRSYYVCYTGRPLTPKDQNNAAKGMCIEGWQYQPCSIIIHSKELHRMQHFFSKKSLSATTQDYHTCVMTLSEGKKREVRRLISFLGGHVVRLIRFSYGPFMLTDLPLKHLRHIPMQTAMKLLKNLKIF